LWDEMLRTDNPDIFRGGGCGGIQPSLSWENACGSNTREQCQHVGKRPGATWLAPVNAYHHLSYFYSDLFELGYEAVASSIPSGRLSRIWKEPFKKVCDLLFGRWQGTGCPSMEMFGDTCAGSTCLNGRIRSIFKTTDLKNRLS